MFIIIGWQDFNILNICSAQVKDLGCHHRREGFKSLYMQFIYMPKGLV
jgi:hypothetical protein